MFPKGYFSDRYFGEQYFGPVVTVAVIVVPPNYPPYSSGGGASEYSKVLNRVYKDDAEVIVLVEEILKCLNLLR
jgi:hypothetical protein